MNIYFNSGIKLAEDWGKYDPTGRSSDVGGISTLASSLLNRAPYILGGLALLALIYSGFMYLTAYGDATKMEQAKKNISWIIIGIIAIAATNAIITIILKIISAIPIEGL